MVRIAGVKGELTHGPPLRRLVSFGLPLVIGSIAHSLFNLVDVWLVGRYAPVDGDGIFQVSREVSLAAIHTSSILNFLPMLVAQGVSVATISIVSQAIGAADARRAANVINRSLLVSVVLGVAFGTIAGFFAKEQIAFLEVPEASRATSTRCLEILSYGSVTMFALLQVTAIERAAGRSMPPLIVLTGANILNALVAVYAVPRYGAVGAAIATVACRGLFAMIAIVWLYWRFAEIRIRPGSLIELFHESVRLLRLGVPASLQIFSRAIAILLIQQRIPDAARATAARLGVEGESYVTDVIAAYSVALRLEMIAMFGCMGLGTAVAAAVGQCVGASMPDRAIRMGWIGAGIAGGMMVLLGAAFYIFSPHLFAFFLEDEQSARLDAIIREGTAYFRIVAFSYIFVGVGIVLAEGLNGAGATRFSFIVDCLVYVVAMQLLVRLAPGAEDISGLWTILAVLHGAVALIYIGMFGSIIRRRTVPVSAIVVA